MTRRPSRRTDSNATPELGELLVPAVHLLKNHAAASRAACHLLAEHGAGADDRLKSRWRRALRDSGEELRRLLEQLDDLGRSLAGPPAVRSHEDLGEWLDRGLDAARISVPGRRVTLTRDPAPPGKWSFAGEPAGLALGCLLRNALLHPPPDSRATVTAGVIKGGLKITVTDDGPGVPAGEGRRLFTPFFRGTAARESPGTGLGLVIARAAAARAGGDVRFLPSRSRGTRFQLRFAARRSSE
jgi:signal transduction histidine kinase